MSELQVWFLGQCGAFQQGANDRKDGVLFSENMSSEWVRGWKWAGFNGFVRRPARTKQQGE